MGLVTVWCSAAAASAGQAPAVQKAVAAHVYKYSSAGFESVGTLGVAVLGNFTSKEYKILAYNNSKQTIATAASTRAALRHCCVVATASSSIDRLIQPSSIDNLPTRHITMSSPQAIYEGFSFTAQADR